jgi:hypothetical protein
MIIDGGGDISLESQQDPPFTVVPMQFDDGCAGRSAIAEVAGLGTVVGGGHGMYLTGGDQMYELSDRVRPTYQALPASLADDWQMLHYSRKNLVVMFASTASGNNLDRALVWNHEFQHMPIHLRPFSVWEYPPLTVVSMITDSTTEAEDVWGADAQGYIYKLDTNTWDGLSDSDLGARSVSGSVTSATGTTVVVDEDFSGLSGDKLVGLEVVVFHSDGTKERRRITGQSGTTTLTVDSAWDATPTSADTWAVGSIEWRWKSGWLNLGTPISLYKKLHHLGIKQVTQASGTNQTLKYQWTHDDGASSLTFATDTHDTVPGPIYGSGETLQLTVEGDAPDAPCEVQYVDIGFFVKGRKPFVAAT